MKISKRTAGLLGGLSFTLALFIPLKGNKADPTTRPAIVKADNSLAMPDADVPFYILGNYAASVETDYKKYEPPANPIFSKIRDDINNDVATIIQDSAPKTIDEIQQIYDRMHGAGGVPYMDLYQALTIGNQCTHGP